MNFYKRYPADYGRKTARLTLAQHGAYSLLLDEVYTSETGLPADADELYRICRAMNKAEQEAVRVVAERFFPVGADGLRHNSRATEELIEAAPAIEAARANGKKGGRPRKETQEKPTGFSPGNPNETQSEPRTKAPHSSESSSLRSEENPRKRATTLDRPDDVAEQVWDDWVQLRKTKRATVTATVIAEARTEAAKASLTLERFLAVWCARGSQGLQADWLKPNERGNTQQASGETPYQRSMRERVEQFAPGVAARAPGQSRPLTFIEEVQNVPAIASR